MKTIIVLVALLVASVATAVDWPQWRGPDRSAVSVETGLLREWPTAGPARAWLSKEAGRGFGSFAVVGDRVYVLGALGEGEHVEHVIALDNAGKKQWTTPIAPAYDFRGNQWSLGPNSTPSVDGRFVYALGSQGVVVCVDDAGHEKWRKDMVKDLQGSVNPVTGEGLGWGYSWSPLVVGDVVVIAPGGDGGLLAALDKKTGALVWRSKAAPDECTYSSPILATFGGVPQVVYAAQKTVYGVALKDGAVLWTYEKKRQAEEIVAATPVVGDNRVFVTGSMAGSDMIDVTKTGDKFAARSAWDIKSFANLHGGVVRLGNRLYGSHENRGWKAIDFATGAEAWELRKPGYGSIAAADGRLYLVSQDDGTVTLAEPTPTGLTIKGQFALPEQSTQRKPSGKLWTHPVIANGRLYLRDQELLFCYTIKG